MKDAANFLQKYSKVFSAGAFATPTAKELAAQPESVREWREAETGSRVIAVARKLARESKRRDWTGAQIILPTGATVITHMARQGTLVPDLDEFDYVFAYREDEGLSRGLIAQQRRIVGTRITAASEIIACWGRRGDRPQHYPRYDEATIEQIPLEVPRKTRQAVLDELVHVKSWHDDFPYYSDGSWSAVSLRGFRRDDPTWGIKPSEMPRTWKAEHPEALNYPCEWTVLADQCPTMRDLVESVSWWKGLERVRLLQMAGRGGKGGTLSRHTDITDRDGGTRDGQIVRFHIPLITHPDIKMHSWDLDGIHRETHLPPWSMWYLDARKPHAVTNPTGVDRVHLVVDVVADPDVRAHL